MRATRSLRSGCAGGWRYGRRWPFASTSATCRNAQSRPCCRHVRVCRWARPRYLNRALLQRPAQCISNSRHRSPARCKKSPTPITIPLHPWCRRGVTLERQAKTFWRLAIVESPPPRPFRSPNQHHPRDISSGVLPSLRGQFFSAGLSLRQSQSSRPKVKNPPSTCCGLQKRPAE